MVALGKMERALIDVPQLKPGEVLVEIAGCGICHSDHTIFYGGIPTALPKILGHEISGVIVAGEPGLIGLEVIIPAVMPCNNCALCNAGRGNRCLAAKIPGYTMGVYGGNSSPTLCLRRISVLSKKRMASPFPTWLWSLMRSLPLTKPLKGPTSSRETW